MEYTTDWFSQHIPNWTVLLSDLKDKPNLHFLEIGCFEGKSSRWLLDTILTDVTSKITVIDAFEDTSEYKDIHVTLKGVYERFEKNVLSDYKDKVTVLKGKSQTVLKTLTGSFDFIYVDGSHEAIATLEDSILAWPNLKKDGVMVWDDFEWYAFQEPTRNPFLAIDAFMSVYRGKYKLLHKGYQVFIRKL